ncbi:hypothetical protein BESB_006770 [Besnoitia besnoiti]|uniref:Helicase C-terminal domain-containing protein n=1 Tax=Besnoitia besnoiti TaxID=94643 RepID=A0A2A9MPP5_BESBE|nr:hypothetical protein BESB_006770 [Besnoitia besnoiti]PFH38336.1 hypothetical protein BESB_006770 [Besnoitia besnoiti]
MLRRSARLRRGPQGQGVPHEAPASPSPFRVWRLPAHLWIPVGCLPLSVSCSQLKLAGIDTESLFSSADDSSPVWLGALKRRTTAHDETAEEVGEEGKLSLLHCARRPSRSASPVGVAKISDEAERLIVDQTCFAVLLSLCGAAVAAWEARLEGAAFAKPRGREGKTDAGPSEPGRPPAEKEPEARQNAAVQLVFTVWMNISPFLMKSNNLVSSQLCQNEFVVSNSEIFLLQHLLPLHTLPCLLRLPLEPLFPALPSRRSASCLPPRALPATSCEEWGTYVDFVRAVACGASEDSDDHEKNSANHVASCGSLLCGSHLPSAPRALSLQSMYDFVSDNAWNLKADEPPPQSLFHFLASTLTKNVDFVSLRARAKSREDPTVERARLPDARNSRSSFPSPSSPSPKVFCCQCHICRLTHEALHVLLSLLDPASLAAFGATNKSHFLLAEPVVPGLQLVVGDSFLHPSASRSDADSFLAPSHLPAALSLPLGGDSSDGWTRPIDCGAAKVRRRSQHVFLGGLFTHQIHGLLWLRHRERRKAAQAPPFCFPSSASYVKDSDALPPLQCSSTGDPGCLDSRLDLGDGETSRGRGRPVDVETGEAETRIGEAGDALTSRIERDAASGECRSADDALKFLAKWTELQLPHQDWLAVQSVGDQTAQGKSPAVRLAGRRERAGRQGLAGETENGQGAGERAGDAEEAPTVRLSPEEDRRGAEEISGVQKKQTGPSGSTLQIVADNDHQEQAVREKSQAGKDAENQDVRKAQGTEEGATADRLAEARAGTRRGGESEEATTDQEYDRSSACFSYRLLINECATLTCLVAPHPAVASPFSQRRRGPLSSSLSTAVSFSRSLSPVSAATTAPQSFSPHPEDVLTVASGKTVDGAGKKTSRTASEGVYVNPCLSVPLAESGAFSLYFNADTRLCAIGYSRTRRVNRAPADLPPRTLPSAPRASSSPASRGREVQPHFSIRGWTHGSRGGGGLFCDDPGLGKTLAMLCLAVKSMGRLPTLPLPVKAWLSGFLAGSRVNFRLGCSGRSAARAASAQEAREGQQREDKEKSEGERVAGNGDLEERRQDDESHLVAVGGDDAVASGLHVWKFEAAEIDRHLTEHRVQSAFAYAQLNPLLQEPTKTAHARQDVSFLSHVASGAEADAAEAARPPASGPFFPSRAPDACISPSVSDVKSAAAPSRFGRTKYFIGYSLPPASALPPALREFALAESNPVADSFLQSGYIRDVLTQLASRELISEEDLEASASQQASARVMQNMKRIYRQLSSSLSSKHGDPNALLRFLINREVSEQLEADERARRLHSRLASSKRAGEEGGAPGSQGDEGDLTRAEPTAGRPADAQEVTCGLPARRHDGEKRREILDERVPTVEALPAGKTHKEAETCQAPSGDGYGGQLPEGAPSSSVGVSSSARLAGAGGGSSPVQVRGEHLLRELKHELERDEGEGEGRQGEDEETLAEEFFAKQDVDLYAQLRPVKPQQLPFPTRPQFLLSQGTLLVCPSPLVNHWSSEVKKWFAWPHCNDADRLKVLVLERRDKSHSVPVPTRAELASCHLVICSQQFLTAEFQRCLTFVWESGPLQRTQKTSSAKCRHPGGHADLLKSPRTTDGGPRVDRLRPTAHRDRHESRQEVEDAIWGVDWQSERLVPTTEPRLGSSDPAPVNRQDGAVGVFGMDDEAEAAGLSLSRLIYGDSRERGSVPARAGVHKGDVTESFRRSRSPLLSIHWQRLVIDEGHTLSRCTSQYVQLCRMIVADKRWVMTGTPTSRQSLRHSLTGLTSLLEFLRYPYALHYQHGGLSMCKTTPLKASICRPLVERGEAASLFKLALLLNTCLVRHSKEQCQRLPALRGPTIYRIEPSAKERETYNDLVQLMQRNLFCTYYSRKNKDSLLHPSQRSQASTSLWNLRFSCTINSEAHLQILIKWIDEAVQMLSNKHEVYQNEFPYNFQFERIVYVVEVYLRLNRPERTYAACDMCRQAIRFPLLIPCPSLHLLCTECVFPQIFSDNLCRRPPLRHCPLCWPCAPVNADFFDRLQPPVEHNTTFDWPFKFTRGARANAELDRRSLVFRTQQSARRDRHRGGRREGESLEREGATAGVAAGVRGGDVAQAPADRYADDEDETIVMEVEASQPSPFTALSRCSSGVQSFSVAAAVSPLTAWMNNRAGSSDAPQKEDDRTHPTATHAAPRNAETWQIRPEENTAEGSGAAASTASGQSLPFAPCLKRVKEQRTFRATAETMRIVRKWFPDEEQAWRARRDAQSGIAPYYTSTVSSAFTCMPQRSEAARVSRRDSEASLGGHADSKAAPCSLISCASSSSPCASLSRCASLSLSASVFCSSAAVRSSDCSSFREPEATPSDRTPLYASCGSDRGAAPTACSSRTDVHAGARFGGSDLNSRGMTDSDRQNPQPKGAKGHRKCRDAGRVLYPRYIDVEDAFAYEFRDETTSGEETRTSAFFSSANHRSPSSPRSSCPRCMLQSPQKLHSRLRSPLHLSPAARSLLSSSPLPYASFSSSSCTSASPRWPASPRSRSGASPRRPAESPAGGQQPSRGAALAARREATLLSLLLSGGISTREVLEEFDDAEVDEEDAIFFSSSKNVLVVRRILQIIHSGEFAQNNIPDSMLEPRQRPHADPFSPSPFPLMSYSSFASLDQNDLRGISVPSTGSSKEQNALSDEPAAAPGAPPMKKVCFGSFPGSPSSSPSLAQQGSLRSPSAPPLGFATNSDGGEEADRIDSAQPLATEATGGMPEGSASDSACNERKPSATPVDATLCEDDAQAIMPEKRRKCGVSFAPTVGSAGSAVLHSEKESLGEDIPATLTKGILKKRSRDVPAQAADGGRRLIKRCPKIIVASSLWENLFLLGCFLEKHRVKCCHFYEKMQEKANRVEALKRFQQDTETIVLLLSTQLGAHGLDLSCASHVLLPDPPTDPNVEQQVISRAHRMGALRDVHVEVFILKDTVEETILHRRGVWTTTSSEASQDGTATKGAAAGQFGKQAFVFGTPSPQGSPSVERKGYSRDNGAATRDAPPYAVAPGVAGTPDVCSTSRTSAKRGGLSASWGPEGTHTHLRKRGVKASGQANLRTGGGDSETREGSEIAPGGMSNWSRSPSAFSCGQDGLSSGQQSPTPGAYSNVCGRLGFQPNWHEMHDEAVGLGEGVQKQTEYLLRTLRTIRRP